MPSKNVNSGLAASFLLFCIFLVAGVSGELGSLVVFIFVVACIVTIFKNTKGAKKEKQDENKSEPIISPRNIWPPNPTQQVTSQQVETPYLNLSQAPRATKKKWRSIKKSFPLETGMPRHNEIHYREGIRRLKLRK